MDSGHTLPIEADKCIPMPQSRQRNAPPCQNLSPPLDPHKAQTWWAEGYLSPRLGSATVGKPRGPRAAAALAVPLAQPQAAESWLEQSEFTSQ